MWPFNKKHKKESTQNSFTFIWYKQMKVGNKIIYTQPFRTTVTAVDYNEAKQKLTEFVCNKFSLVTVLENDYPKTDLSKYENKFNELYKLMDKMMDSFNKLI